MTNIDQFKPNPTNGTGVGDILSSLPPTREAVVEQGLRIQQETAAERDQLRRDVEQLRSDIAAYKVAIEALTAQLAQADSRIETMTVVRDDAVRRQAELETVLASMLALGRAFSIKSKPLITGAGDDEVGLADLDRRFVRDIGRDIG